MSLRPLRTGALALVDSAALGLAACGGGDGDSIDDYKASLKQFCGAVKRSQESVEAKIRKVETDPKLAKDPQGLVDGFAAALDGFGKELRVALGDLEQTDPPEKYQAYHDGTAKAIDQLADQFERATAATKKGDVKALNAFGSRVDAIKAPTPPSELRKGVPDCDELSNS